MDSGNLKIGEYEESDIGEIIAIEKESFPTPWSENIFRSEMASPISRFLVAKVSHELGERVAGYLAYLHVADEIHLHNIAVRWDMRRTGVASRLLGEAVRRSWLKQARWVTLEVRQSNHSAQQFYEKFGFSVRGVRPGYYTDTREDALIMWADLTLIPLEKHGPDEIGESGNV
jgi:[ribosomal protein S18]-alanine N-acetyltransferase